MCSSYVVLIGVSLVLLLEQGTIKSLGVFLPQLQEQFVTATWVIGLAISFTPGIGSLACKYSTNEYSRGINFNLTLKVENKFILVKLFCLNDTLTLTNMATDYNTPLR